MICQLTEIWEQQPSNGTRTRGEDKRLTKDGERGGKIDRGIVGKNLSSSGILFSRHITQPNKRSRSP
ncbi:unnamed protein product [Calypogeia fissa]